MKAVLLPWFVLASGIFTLICAVANWDWFFNSSRARPLNEAIGRGGARALHVVLGLLLTLSGLYLLVDRNSARTPRELRAHSPADE